MGGTHRSGEVQPGAVGEALDRAQLASGTIVVLGLGLVGGAVAAWGVTDIAVFDATITAVPGLAVIAAWLWFRRSADVRRAAGHVARWVFGTGVVLGGFILAVLIVQGGSLVDGGPLLLFMTGTGGALGVVMGVNRVRGIQARRRAEALQTERERLDFLNQLLRHNVLNKVNIIKGNATFAAEEVDGSGEYYDVITHQSDDIVELIENVRVLVDATTAAAETEVVDLSTVLAREITSLRQAHEAADIAADVPDGLTVLADDLLPYVFENLLSNAIEHNDRDEPAVTVSVDTTEAAVTVHVADDGPGLPADRRETIFQPQRGDHGLGLYLVETLVSNYGGEITVADNEPRGTVFSVRLPAA